MFSNEVEQHRAALDAYTYLNSLALTNAEATAMAAALEDTPTDFTFYKDTRELDALLGCIREELAAQAIDKAGLCSEELMLSAVFGPTRAVKVVNLIKDTMARRNYSPVEIQEYCEESMDINGPEWWKQFAVEDGSAGIYLIMLLRDVEKYFST